MEMYPAFVINLEDKYLTTDSNVIDSLPLPRSRPLGVDRIIFNGTVIKLAKLKNPYNRRIFLPEDIMYHLLRGEDPYVDESPTVLNGLVAIK
jgi:hypothetical protein